MIIIIWAIAKIHRDRVCSCSFFYIPFAHHWHRCILTLRVCIYFFVLFLFLIHVFAVGFCLLFRIACAETSLIGRVYGQHSSIIRTYIYYNASCIYVWFWLRSMAEMPLFVYMFNDKMRFYLSWKRIMFPSSCRYIQYTIKDIAVFFLFYAMLYGRLLRQKEKFIWCNASKLGPLITWFIK